MRSSRVLSLAAGSTALALATLVVAAPASAATLPAGQRITIVEFQDTSDPTEGQFYDVNPADAASTPVGTATQQTVIGIEVGDDGIGAAIGQLDSESTIWTANANTGTLTDPHTITVNGQIAVDSCGGIDLVNGTFIVACVEDGNNVTHVGAVDPGTGILIPFLTLSDGDFLEFDALANDEVTAQLWGFAEIEGVPHSFTIDLEHDVVEEVATMDDDIFAADFDRDGQLFVSTQQLIDDEFDVPALAVANPFTGAFLSIDPYVSTATDAALTFVAALTIWGAEPPPGPALANTGATGAEIAPLAIGSVLLLLAGGAFVLTSRLERKRA